MRSAALLVVLLGPAANAEYQLRFVTHEQRIMKGQTAGFAAWAVLPDVMHVPPLRTLLLCGWVYKNERRWIEVMAGELLSSNGRPSPELDVRFLDRSSRVQFFVEGEYNVRMRRFGLLPNATVPLPIGSGRMRVGAESDFVFQPHHRLIGIGPRLSIPLPVCRLLCADASVITAYRVQSDGRRVLRHYVVFNF